MMTKIVFLSLLLAAGQMSKLAAQGPGTSTATGNMTTPRSFNSAVLLGDGRVLIAGGDAYSKTLSSAELYDARVGRFTATGNMTTPRSGHTATLLADGKVLIAGGIRTNERAFGAALSSAELYDPRTGAFTPTGGMSVPRVGPAATLLNNGKVLFAGGVYAGQDDSCAPDSAVFYAGSCFPVTAELYDPDTGTFTATGDMITEFVDTATLLPDGKVLITKGNLQRGGQYLTSAELYDPTTGTFTFAGYAKTNHSGPTATLMMNGKVLIAGGDWGDGDGGSFIAEVYDPATGTFSGTLNMTVGREQHTATLLPDGNVLFAGGHLVFDLAVSTEIYDPIKGAFTRTANMSTAHEMHTATLLGDGTVLITGGFMPFPALTSSAELYHPAVLVPAPQLLASAGGRGQGAILHANTAQLASPVNPAVVGESLEIYSTGVGDGKQIPPQVSIGGRMADVLWFGNTPGYVGLNQINVRVPAGVTPGDAVPVRLAYVGRLSNEVTIGVR
jgi:uncharacterized protein (TIGR03437 family)